MKNQYPVWLICVVFAVCLLAPRSLAFLPFVPALIAYIVLSWQRRAPQPVDKALAAFLGGIVLLGLTSTLWAQDSGEVVDRMLNTGGIFLGGILLLSVLDKQIFTARSGFFALCAFYILAGFYLAFEYKTYFALTSTLLDKHIDPWNFNRSFVFYCVAFVPMVFLANRICHQRRHKYALIALLASAVLLPLMLTQSQTAQLATLAAAASFLLFRLIKTQGHRNKLYLLSAFAICAMIMSAPLLPGMLKNLLETEASQTVIAQKANMAGRIEIWNFVADYIHEKPMLGYGIEGAQNFESKEILPYNRATNFLHPHNSYLQIWAELGLVGALTACLLICFTIRRIAQSDPAFQPVYFAVFAAFIALLATGYGLWQSWHLGLIFAGVAFARIVTRVHPPIKSVI